MFNLTAAEDICQALAGLQHLCGRFPPGREASAFTVSPNIANSMFQAGAVFQINIELKISLLSFLTLL